MLRFAFPTLLLLILGGGLSPSSRAERLPTDQIGERHTTQAEFVGFIQGDYLYALFATADAEEDMSLLVNADEACFIATEFESLFDLQYANVTRDIPEAGGPQEVAVLEDLKADNRSFKSWRLNPKKPNRETCAKLIEAQQVSLEDGEPE